MEIFSAVIVVCFVYCACFGIPWVLKTYVFLDNKAEKPAKKYTADYSLHHSIVTQAIKQFNHNNTDFTLVCPLKTKDVSYESLMDFLEDLFEKAEGNPDAFVKANPNKQFLFAQVACEEKIPFAFVQDISTTTTMIFFFNTMYLATLLMRIQFGVYTGKPDASVVDICQEIVSNINFEKICQKAAKEGRKITIYGWAFAGMLAIFSYATLIKYISKSQQKRLQKLCIIGMTWDAPRCLKRKVKDEIRHLEKEKKLNCRMENYESPSNPLSRMFSRSHFVAVNSVFLEEE